MPIARIGFPLSMELLGSRHDTSNFAEQAEQNWLQILKGKGIGGLDLAHVLGKKDGAGGRVQTEYLFMGALWSSTPIQRFTQVSLYIKGSNPGNKFLNKGRWKFIF